MSPLGALGLALVLGAGTEKAGLKWESSFEEALQKAKASGKTVLIDFWAEWCGWCHRLDQTTYVDPQVVKLGEDFVAVKVDTEGGRKQQQVAERYDVQQLPTILFVSPEGRAVLRVQGYQGPGQFPTTMEKARAVGARVIAWEAAIDKDPRQAAALMRLGIHLFEQESYEESRDLLRRTTKSDAESPPHDRRKTRMLLGIIQSYDKKYGDAEDVLRDALAIKPADDLQPRLLFVLGRAYYNWGKPDKARETMQRILAGYPGSQVAAKARETIAALDTRKK